MSVLAPGVAWVDLQFRGSPHVIATAVLSGSGGAALVDPGPASCLDSLELGLSGMGIRFEDVTHILLTHVHLDHGGSTGTLLRRYPAAEMPLITSASSIDSAVWRWWATSPASE
jgi:glyoxylase-like metal-dependent hydrolase (beta-lactamase superfamily II)